MGGDSWGSNSTEHKGLFLLSFLCIGTGSLTRLSPDGAALTASHARRTRIRATLAGIAEQFALQLDKLSAGTTSFGDGQHADVPLSSEYVHSILLLVYAECRPARDWTEMHHDHVDFEPSLVAR